MRILLFILLLLTLEYSASAQLEDKQVVAQKIAQIKNTPLDTAQVNQLKNLGYALIEIDSLRSRQLLEEALEKSLKLKEKNLIANCYRSLGLWYHFFSRPDKTLHYYYLSLQYAQAAKNHYLYGGVLYNIGNVNYSVGKYDSSIYYYTKADEAFNNPQILANHYATEIELNRRKSDLYSNFSAVFNSLGNLTKAEEYIDRAIALSKKYNSPAATDALAFYMQQKADNYHEMGNIDKAIRIRLDFLPQMEQGNGTRESVQNSYQNISKEYFLLNKIDSSILFAYKSLELAKKINSISGTASANKQLAVLAMHEKRYNDAAAYMEIVKPYYEASEDLLEKRSFYESMHALNGKLGRYREALQYAEKYIAVNDSIMIGEKSKAFSALEAKYEDQKKQSQIKLQQTQLKQKNILNYILIGGLIALLIIIILSYRNYTQHRKLQQQKINELETEKQLLATQSVLKGVEEERSRIAKDLHDGLGGLLSGVKLQLGAMKGNLILTEENGIAFNRVLHNLEDSIAEMRRVAHNMMPETLLKFGLEQALTDYSNSLSHQQKFNIQCTFRGMERRFDNSTEVVIYRIVQELINNAVKHSDANTILVQLMRHDEAYINITVEDNGKGYQPNEVKENSAGLKNIASRVKYLNGKMDIQSEPGKGTSVFIECELKS